MYEAKVEIRRTKGKNLIPFLMVLMFVFFTSIGTITIANATTLDSSITYPLTAGKTTVIGTITVTPVGSNLLVSYHTDTLSMTENHLNITTTIPTDKGEPGHYTYTNTGTVKDFTFTVPIGTYTAGQTIYLMTHATAAGETAYGGTILDTQQGSWFGYISYTIPILTPANGNLEVKYVDENGKDITSSLKTTVTFNYKKVIVPNEITPATPATPVLPKTGGIPAGVFYGFGSILVVLGTTLRFRSKK